MPSRTRSSPTKSRTSLLDELNEAARTSPGKNPLAVALGRRGGLVGGPATAKKLSAAQRSRNARKAARARFKKKS